MRKQETFYTAGEEERKAMSQVIHLFKEMYDKRGQEIIYYVVPSSKMDKYDFLIHVYKEGQKIESNIIEVKVRSKHFNRLLLEKRKYNSLKKLKKIEEEAFNNVNIIYLNFTPQGTYLFNLTDKRFNWESLYANKCTIRSREDKVEKLVTFLDVNDGIDMKIIYDKDKDNKIMDEKLKEQERYRCIFESVKKMK